MKYLFPAVCMLLIASCQNVANLSDEVMLPSGSVDAAMAAADTALATTPESKSTATVAANDAAAILARPQVPVLCYHHIRENKPGQSETFKTYSVSPAQFASQMKALHDSGYQTILPDELLNYLLYNAPLPPKPVMITFDDSIEGQYTLALPEMEKWGFKGVFFLMTISLNKPGYMTRQQVKELAARGHSIQSHTWDHHRVDRYAGDDFEKQFAGSNRTIEEITGQPVRYFAYPYGLWSRHAFEEMERAGYSMAFILSGERDSSHPQLTVRRMIVPSQWSTKGMMGAMTKTFKR